MIFLKKLEISNAGRFVGKHVIDFSSKKGLIQIDASNKNTGGSSGSGKSTIFNSLEYLLGINNIPSTVLQSRLVKDALEVSATFNDSDGREINVRRAKSGGLTISINNEDVVSGNVKAAEEVLDSIIGIPRSLLRQVIHKRQKEGGFFLNLSAKETHAFLTEVLGLKSWSEKLAKIQDQEKEEKNKVTHLSATISALSSKVVSLENSINGLKKPEIDFNESIIGVLGAQLEKMKAEESTVLLEADKELSSIVKPEKPQTVNIQINENSEIRQKIAELRAIEKTENENYSKLLYSQQVLISSAESEIKDKRSTLQRLKSSEAKLSDIKQKILKLKENKCPTCDQHWQQNELELQKNIEVAKSYMADIDQIPSVSAEIDSLSNRLASLVSALDELKNQRPKDFKNEIMALELEERKQVSAQSEHNAKVLAAYNVALDLVKTKEDEVRKKYSDRLQNIRYSISEQSKLYVEKKTQLENFTKSLSLYEDNLKILKEDLYRSKIQLEQNKIDLSGVEHKLLVISDTAALISSYTNNLFQDALASIADKATTILSRIPNMQTSSIYFEGFKESKNGTIKEEVSAVLTMDGEIGIPIKSMSGGERTAIDLAVDMAVISMIEEITSKGIDIFILDEPFDGLDSACREQCLEVLRNSITDKKVIVVDHSNETKEMVSDRITVVREGQFSYINQ